MERTNDAILITGAGGGIGVELSNALLEAGYKKLLFHHRRRSEEISGVVKKHGLDPQRVLFTGDLTDEEQVRGMHERIREQHGPLYGLVNVAGGSSNGMTWKLSKADFQGVLDANLMTTFLSCRQFIPEMREHGRGRIINFSSVVGFTGAAGVAHYCAAKAAVVGFTKAIALELAPKKIAACVVALGYFPYGLIHTIPAAQLEHIQGTIPARRLGEIQELGGLMRYLLSDAGAYSGGQVYHLNGGLYT